MWDYNYSDELYHYGILGMKWGVRRSETQLSRVRGRKKNDSDDYKQASELKKKKISELSNAELRKLNERTQLERQYSQLNPNAVKKGLTYVTATAATLGTLMALYNNGGKAIQIGKTYCDKITKVVGDKLVSELNKNN